MRFLLAAAALVLVPGAAAQTADSTEAARFDSLQVVLERSVIGLMQGGAQELQADTATVSLVDEEAARLAMEFARFLSLFEGTAEMLTLAAAMESEVDRDHLRFVAGMKAGQLLYRSDGLQEALLVAADSGHPLAARYRFLAGWVGALEEELRQVMQGSPPR